MKKNILVPIIVLTILLWISCPSFSADLFTIQQPYQRQILTYEPIDISLHLGTDANPATFHALLNGNDISGHFERDGQRLDARVGSDDGLNIYREDKRGSTRRQGLNRLEIRVAAIGSEQAEIEQRVFFVKTADVSVTRDEKGVWFITGSDKVSLYTIHEAMGYTVACDRLWQMELYRRQARGRLSEIFGPDLLDADIFWRTYGYSGQELKEAGESLDDVSKMILKGYAAGINRRLSEIQADPSLLPFEFIALGMETIGSPLMPGPWEVEDLLAWLVTLQRSFDPEALDMTQIQNARLLIHLISNYGVLDGLKMFNDLRWIDDPAAATVIPTNAKPSSTSSMPNENIWLESDPESVTTENVWLESDPESIATDSIAASSDFAEALSQLTRSQADNTVGSQMLDQRNGMTESLKKLNAHVKMGSYAWVVSGDKTTSGNPVIYSGPQMGFTTPSIVIEGSIQAGGLNVSGMSVPGLPVILTGRTPHHAWSVQVGHAHTTDFYFEDPADVELDRIETITILGEPDLNLPIYKSVHGPIVSPIPYDPSNYDPDPNNPIVAWKYSHRGYEFHAVRGFYDLATAKSTHDFERAVRGLAISLHICYTDKDRNIAYWMSGRDPVRPVGEWRLPQGILPGFSREWNPRYIKPLPSDMNTPRGWYAGWNNKSKPGASGFNSALSIFGPFHRTHILYDYIKTQCADNGKMSFNEIRDTALFIGSTDSFGEGGNPWQFVADVFNAIVTSAGPNSKREAALAMLNNWDGHFIAGGPEQWLWGPNRADAWILMDRWLRAVIGLTFRDELGRIQDGAEPVLTELPDLLFNVFLHGLDSQVAPNVIFSISQLTNRYNWFQNLKDPAAPQTVDAIVLTALDTVLEDLGNVPWGAGIRGAIEYQHDLLGQLHTTPFLSRSSYAHCVEFGPNGPVRIESMFPLGESGDIRMGPEGDPIFDPNGFSMVPIFDGCVYRPFPLFD